MHPIPTLRAVRHLGPGGNGMSRAQLFSTADGQICHVKLKGNPHGLKSLAAELIATRLGQLVGAAVPQGVLVQVPEGMISNAPSLLAFRGRGGLQFGSLFLSGAMPWPQVDPHLVLAIGNRQALPITALLELWLMNNDLRPEHLLLAPMAEGPALVVTDHDNILPHNPHWSTDSLTRGRDAITRPEALLSLLALFHWPPLCLQQAHQRLLQVTAHQIASIIAEIPSEWLLRPDEIGALFDYLLHRQSRLGAWLEHLHPPLLSVFDARLNPPGANPHRLPPSAHWLPRS